MSDTSTMPCTQCGVDEYYVVYAESLSGGVSYYNFDKKCNVIRYVNNTVVECVHRWYNARDDEWSNMNPLYAGEVAVDEVLAVFPVSRLGMIKVGKIE